MKGNQHILNNSKDAYLLAMTQEWKQLEDVDSLRMDKLIHFKKKNEK